MSIKIKMAREVSIKDKDNWIKLYKEYADFHKLKINDKILNTVWSWLMDKNHEFKGIVYEVDDNLAALAHYRAMPRPLKANILVFLMICMLILIIEIKKLLRS